MLLATLLQTFRWIKSFIYKYPVLLSFLLCLIITGAYFFPMFSGLILLPLDLLIERHGPWYLLSTMPIKNTFMNDSILQMYPWKLLVFQSLNQGIIPFWNPYTLMGTPFMASMKPMVFYPFVLLVFKLGPVVGWNTLLFLQVLLSMFFTYLFLREFKLPSLVCLFGGLIYSLNSLMMGVLEFGSEGHVLLWFPLLFFAVKRYYDKGSWWTLPMISFGIASSILAGQMQYFIYHIFFVFIFILLYGIWQKRKIQQFSALFVAMALGCGITAVQIFPSLELIHFANRSYDASRLQFTSSLLMPWNLLRLLSPDLFGNPVHGTYSLNYIEGSGYFGIIPLFFAIYALIFSKKTRPLYFFLFMAGLGILLSLQITGKYLAYSGLQFLIYGAGYRIFSLIYLPAALLSGIGLYVFVENRHFFQKKIYLSIFSLILVMIFGILHIFQAKLEPLGFYPAESTFSLLIFAIFTCITIVYLLSKYIQKYFTWLFIISVLVITFFDLFHMGYRFLTYSNSQFLYPSTESTEYLKEHTKQTLGRSYGLFDPELGSIFQLSTPETYNPLYLKQTRLTMDSLIGKPSNILDSSSSYYLNRDYGNSLKPALDFLGVQYLAIGRDHNPSTEYFYTTAYERTFFPPIYRSNTYDIFLNKKAYPRFNVFYHIQPVKDDEEALKLLKQHNINFENTLILESPSFIPSTTGKSSISVNSYNLNNASFTVSTSERGYFYLSDAYYPGWTATINGSPVHIVRADADFRAVPIPKGKSIITFSYIPTNFYLYLALSLACCVLASFPILFHSLCYLQSLLRRFYTIGA